MADEYPDVAYFVNELGFKVYPRLDDLVRRMSPPWSVERRNHCLGALYSVAANTTEADLSRKWLNSLIANRESERINLRMPIRLFLLCTSASFDAAAQAVDIAVFDKRLTDRVNFDDYFRRRFIDRQIKANVSLSNSCGLASLLSVDSVTRNLKWDEFYNLRNSTTHAMVPMLIFSPDALRWMPPTSDATLNDRLDHFFFGPAVRTRAEIEPLLHPEPIVEAVNNWAEASRRYLKLLLEAMEEIWTNGTIQTL